MTDWHHFWRRNGRGIAQLAGAVLGPYVLLCSAFYAVNYVLEGYGAKSGDSATQLIPDSSLTRDIIRRIEPLSQNKNAFIPFLRRGREFEQEHHVERMTLLAVLPKNAELIIPPNTICRVLKYSDSSCSKQPGLDSTFVLLRIPAGPAKGKTGWACMFENVWLPGPFFP